MSRALFVHGFGLLALASCATVSGLADKEAVECPGGCIDATTPPQPSASPTSTSTGSSDAGPPPTSDGGDAGAGFVKPDGWELVAVATVANGAAAPGCPTGFDDASDIGASPSARSDTCECACTVTQQAVCAGDPAIVRSDLSNCSQPLSVFGFSNSPPGGCNSDMSQFDRTGEYYKVRLAPATGGACNAGATPHPDRVNFAERRRVCDETSRCSGNVCDATVSAPFTACVASPKGSGDKACPTSFSNKLVAGAASVTCDAQDCGCTVNRTCTGSLTFYKDSLCTSGAATVTADDTCRNPNASGSYIRYKVAATPTTTCAGNGTAPATVTANDVRTVCCR
jgi:hypothetical protein